MDSVIRLAQWDVLRIFSQAPGGFALSGGTALELYYLKHRFSSDLDFFSTEFDLKEIKKIVLAVSRHSSRVMRLESELMLKGRARVQFYTLPVPGSYRPLKIDFVEDIFSRFFARLPRSEQRSGTEPARQGGQSRKPVIKTFSGVPVYGVKEIYFQKIAALSGTLSEEDSIGRATSAGRGEPRDAVDIYYLSKKVEPLHRFLKTVPSVQQRRIIHWWRSFPRMEYKLGFLDLEIYDKKFDGGEVLEHIDQEINLFLKEIVE